MKRYFNSSIVIAIITVLSLDIMVVSYGFIAGLQLGDFFTAKILAYNVIDVAMIWALVYLVKKG